MRPKLGSRDYSDKYEENATDLDLLLNKNVDWFSMTWTKPSYVLLIVIFWFSLHATGTIDAKDCWTITSMVHGVMTFVLFHWIKGNPDGGSQGAYNHLTLYEQIDAGVPWTSTKKFLILVPTMLMLGSCVVASYEPIYVVVNGSVFLIMVLAKLPAMHRVRIFGINSTVGIDSKIEYTPPRTGGSKRD